MSCLFRIKQSILTQTQAQNLVPLRLLQATPPFLKHQAALSPHRNPKFRARRMLNSRRKEEEEGDPYRDPSSNPKVTQLREVMTSAHPSDGWEKSWEEGIVPWDLGKPTPVLVRLVQANSLPKGRALVPGCGTGYDVVALASSERYVVGLDISLTAVKKAQQWSASFANKDQFAFLAEDFFKWNPEELFDLIFDYTFFCAIEPDMRPAWAKKINQLLKPNGELITLIYLITDQKEGPPFNNTLLDYEKVLNPLGFKAISIEDNELAVKPRKGREKLVRWKRILTQSSL
ncbi:hypothetical protein LUZ60_001925 [Juncus effusus]|nr:hypothetical protein LUZ60_001925 [Juncus effusus]